MKNLMKKVLGVALVMGSMSSYADVSVIVNTTNANEITQKDISRIFLGKKKDFANGDKAVPIAMKEGSDTQNQFNADVLGKNPTQIKAYWSQLVFTGQAKPPQEYTSEEIKKIVSTNPNVIGYIDTKDVDSSVRVVLQK